MNDLTELFHRVAPAPEGDVAPLTIDGDVERGHQALARSQRQRTIRRSMAATATVAAVAVGVVAVAQLHGSGATHHNVVLGGEHHHVSSTTSSTKTKAKTKVRKAPAIKLVDYTGDQLAGFTVDEVPQGWHLSSSSPFALLIDASGDTNNDASDFAGKLAVLTSSIDEHGLGHGDSVTVNGQPGVVSDQGQYGIMLRYNDPAGFGVDIQAPAALNWTDAQIVSFAEGVHVTGDAQHSRG